MRTRPVPPLAPAATCAPAWPRLARGLVAIALAAPLVGGCAARVSRSGPNAAFSSAAVAPAPAAGLAKRAPKAARPAPAATPRASEAPAPAPEAKPVAVTWVTTSPSSLPAGETDEAPGAPPVKVAAPAPKAAPAPATPKKKSYHAYSDGELGALRKRSRAFKKLDDELRGCTKRSEAAIERRESIPTEIARIRMSKGGLDAAKERKIAALNAELEQLRTARGAEDCAPLEAEATAMLEEHFRADDAIY